MPFALDASVTLVWCFDDEEVPYAARVMERFPDDTALVPSIWPLEVANALPTAERRGHLLPAKSARFVELVGTLPIEVDHMPVDHVLTAVRGVATTYGLTSYDASYLELAMRRGLPLATYDARLSGAATHAGVQLYLQ